MTEQTLIWLSLQEIRHRMTEVKSVKVDNWGVFFLQKLQNFFNKTDYCDLTLQFKDNSQLKVHRLVLSACTDYFNLLETTCEMHGDILIMPRDLQADVVVPIVNFMYTGTLEFEVMMYERLLKTARDMNMTVLLKLLEAHRRSIPSRSAPVILNKSAQQQRVVQTRGPNVRQVERTYASAGRVTQIGGITIKKEPGVTYVRKPMSDPVPEPVALVSKYPHVGSKTGPSRFEPPDENISEAFDSSFNPISYESKPLITADQVSREEDDEETKASVFEKLRKSGYTNPNKRPATASASPPHKKLNLQDVKEYTEAAKLRKQIEEEAEDDPREYDDADDTYSNSSDEQQSGRAVSKAKKDQRPTVVVQESGKVNHAKIISEVLKKYPHLVKNNKNIKLKIMQKSPQGRTVEAEQVEVKPKPSFRTTPPAKQLPVDPKSLARGGRIDSKTMHALIAKGAENMEGPWLCLRCGVDGRPIGIPTYKGFRRHLINVHHEKIDPRICEHCGWKARSSRKTELYYHILVKHKIKPPDNMSFPRCKECPFIAPDEVTMNKHHVDVHGKKKVHHQTCIYCNKSFQSETALFKHMHSQHKQRARQDGILDDSDAEQEMEQYEDEADKYVPNVEESELAETSDQKIKILSNISLPSTKSIPFVLDPSAQHVNQIQGKAAAKLEPSSEAEALSNVASGIATSLGLVEGSVVIGEAHQFQGDSDLISSQYIEAAMADVHGEYGSKKTDQEIMTKLVTEDGSELELTPAQKEELMSQLQGESDNVVMVLNQDNFVEGNTEIINSADQKIVVVYSQADDGLKEAYLHAGDIKDSVLTPSTPMEWQGSNTQDTEDNSQENIPTSQDEEDSKKQEENPAEEEEEESKKPIEEEKTDESSKKSKSDEDKLKLISELEGDWSEDEDMGLEAAKDDASKQEGIRVILRTSTNPSVDDEVGLKEQSAVEEVEQNLSALLEDWNNDSQTSAKESVEEANGKKEEPEKVEKDEETDKLESQKSAEEDKEDAKSDDGKKSSEIKTLINDWGDDDEDL
ncbi:centrosome-associated zinc finger protein CP190 [Phlebotomus argentipes]|uniref:centrosome-associated zinc finger protein CP190 n=1 Tax=Phlebotomus argentipes TaxID=94469 RepID=UPI002892EB18|nr:centrosome-associated zinc finger protein CP190 [Phlebotomus argentipes]